MNYGFYINVMQFITTIYINLQELPMPQNVAATGIKLKSKVDNCSLKVTGLFGMQNSNKTVHINLAFLLMQTVKKTK